MKNSSLPVLVGWCVAGSVVFAAACGDNLGPAAGSDDLPDAGLLPDAEPPPPPPPPPAPALWVFDDPMAIDVSPDGAAAVLEQVRQDGVDVVVVDTITGEPRVVTTLADASRNVV